MPEDSTLSLFYTGTTDGSLSEAHTRYFQSQADEAKATLHVEQSHFFPELSIGYTRQDILPLKNLNAWMVGVSFPIYFLQQSETGIAEYIQSIATARDIRRGYIETVYQYNIAALEYELFK